MVSRKGSIQIHPGLTSPKKSQVSSEISGWQQCITFSLFLLSPKIFRDIQPASTTHLANQHSFFSNTPSVLNLNTIIGSRRKLLALPPVFLNLFFFFLSFLDSHLSWVKLGINPSEWLMLNWCKESIHYYVHPRADTMVGWLITWSCSSGWGKELVTLQNMHLHMVLFCNAYMPIKWVGCSNIQKFSIWT